MRKGRTNENKNLFYLEDLKSFFGSFACANETRALQQVSCVRASLQSLTLCQSKAHLEASHQLLLWSFERVSLGLLYYLVL